MKSAMKQYKQLGRLRSQKCEFTRKMDLAQDDNSDSHEEIEETQPISKYTSPPLSRQTSFDHLEDLPEEENPTMILNELYQRRLHDVVCRVFNDVSVHPNARKLQLEELFNDLCSRIADTVQGKLHNKHTYYFEILAEYYYRESEKANEFLIMGSKSDLLWDSYQYEMICSLVLYQWLFQFQEARKTLFHKLVKNIYKMFSMDIDSRTRTFEPIFQFIYYQVLLSPKFWQTSAVHEFVLEFFSVISQFYFYYQDTNDQDDLIAFLNTTSILFFQEGIKPHLVAHPKVHTLNMFVNEIVRRLRLLKDEKVIVHYLRRCEYLVGSLAIPGTKTNMRLHSLLLDNSTPGSPLYPTRAIRRQATRTINLLYPSGRVPRTLVNYGFRVLHPIELGRSWYFWFHNGIIGLWLFLVGVWALIFNGFWKVFSCGGRLSCCGLCRKDDNERIKED